MMKKASKTKSNEDEAAFFKALADPTRLNLVKILCHQHEPDALCVNALAKLHGISQSAVSQHLRILKNVGLVKGERKGYHIHYNIDHDMLKRCHELIAAALETD